ncbi:MAG: prolyl oligopeptidase family serine peptidase [Kiritimatiellaeota bacterium]|nr:prolyl oligopeptidase family serine peptidase [Kiritimatiellota bacterium]
MRKTLSSVAAAVCLVLSCAVVRAAPSPARVAAWRESAIARAQLHLLRAGLAERRPFAETTPGLEYAAALRAFHDATNAAPVLPPRGLLLDAYTARNDNAPQPFFRFLPSSWEPETPLPLLVYLHGFYTYDALSPPGIPAGFTNFAERAGFAVAAPFGRSNTDFQGVGEQDVLRVVELMRQRCGVDTNRVVIAGYSMGGMGAWNIASRWPGRFRGMLAIGNRGDFYAWHGVAPDDLPPWQRRSIDTQFAAAHARNLAAMPILAIHGADDIVMPEREARAIFERVRDNPNARLAVLPNTTHQDLYAQFTNATVHAWITNAFSTAAARSAAASLQPFPGASGSRAQDLFLDPFVIVGDEASPDTTLAFLRWRAFTQSVPRLAPEAALTPEHLQAFSLLLPAAPEDSPLVARLLKHLGATVTPDTLTIAGRSFPRAERGFWVAAPSPENPRLTWLANFGLEWGPYLSANPYYDRIPDFICYTAETGAFDLPVPEGVAFLNADGKLEWSDPPFTPFSKENATPGY